MYVIKTVFKSTGMRNTTFRMVATCRRRGMGQAGRPQVAHWLAGWGFVGVAYANKGIGKCKSVWIK